MIEAFAGKPNNRDGDKPTEVPKRDMEVREGDHLDLGDQHLIIHTAPGHTPGNLFVEGLALHDGAQTYRGIWGGGGRRAGPCRRRAGSEERREAERREGRAGLYHDPCLAGPERLSGRRHP